MFAVTNNLNADYIQAVLSTVQNNLSSYLPSENIKTVMYKNVICASVLYWCETWSLILREEHLRVFDKRERMKWFYIMMLPVSKIM
jgi:hypothetical protein